MASNVRDSDPNPENRAAFRDLLRALETSQPLALVGAGVSVRAGYPTWKRLLQRLHERAERKAKWSQLERAALLEHPDFLWRADVYRAAMGATVFERFLSRQFSPNGHRVDQLSRDLVRAGFSHFLTTNYDSLLERAQSNRGANKESVCVRWEDRDALREFITGLGEHRTRVSRVVYLHGRYDHPESLVLTEQSYLERYVKSDEARKKLFAIFAIKRVVFIGFSLDDPDLTLLLREVKANLGVQNGRHFVLMSLKESEEDPVVVRERMNSKFGVIPIFFPYSVGYTGLDKTVQALLKRDPRHLPRLRAPVAEESLPLRPVVDPEDPQKGRWGGEMSNPDRALSAKVTEDGDGWFKVQLLLKSLTKDRPLKKPVYFHLHDTFVPQMQEAEQVENGLASLEISAYGAFTVGAEADGGKTRLELNLAKLKSAPRAFRAR